MRVFWILAALFALMACAGVLLLLDDVDDFDVSSSGLPPRPVTFVEAKIGTHSGSVSVFAEVTPRWQVDLRSRVSGVVTRAKSIALAGTRVLAGTVLLELENAPYLASLEEARSTLESSRLALKRKRNKHAISLKDWQAVNPQKTPPDMAVHLPEVRVAEQAVAAAKARVEAAKYDLDSTVLRAPFDAIVTKRQASPGATVNEGDVLFTLLDNTVLDIQASVNHREWALLDRTKWTDAVPIYNENNARIGTAGVRQGGGFLDPKSRKHQLFLQVQNTEGTDLIPGAFVRVNLPGCGLEDTIKAPESALTQNGYLWYIDENDKLRRFEAKALFRDNGSVVVAVPDRLKKLAVLRVVVLPMSAYLPGQKISPVTREVAE